jgi:oligo-alginate lyase
MEMNRRELMQGIIASAIASAGIPYARATAFSPRSAADSVRPRLYLNPPTLAHLQERFRADAEWAAQLVRDGDAMLAEDLVPESVAEQGGGAQANYVRPSHQLAFMSVTLGLLYQLTKQVKYAAKLHAALEHYTSYVRWGGQGLVDRDPSWHSELDTAQFCFGAGNGYDVLYHFLSPQQRQQIRDAIVRLGIAPTLEDWITPGTRFHSFDSMGHNWWGVCVSGAGIAALALLGDDDRAPQWIDALDQGFVQWFTYDGNRLHNRIETFEPDGGPSYEGVGYTGYGVTSYLRYLLAWKNNFPQRKAATMQFLTGLPEFMLHTLYPASTGNLQVNFEDCHIASTAADCILLLKACGVENEYGRAYLHYAHGPMQDPLPVYVPSSPSPANTALPLSKVYPKMGWAMMRDSWQNDATLLAVKSGYTWNHAHADASTFLLMHKGSPLVIDSGTCAYSRHEYSSYYRQSIAHNVVLYDGKGQPADQINVGAKFRGSILNWFDGLGLRYIGADATGPSADQATRHYRHFLWMGDVLLILDDIATHRDVRLDWMLHTAGNTQEDGPQSLRLQNGAAAARLTMLYPDGVTIEQRDGLAPERPDDHVPYHAFLFNTQNRRQRVVTALDLNPAAPATMEIREHPRYLEITVHAGDETHRVYLNLRSIDGAYDMSSTIQIDDWSTDAYLLAVTHPRNATDLPAGASRFFVMDGSFLRHGRISVLECLSKASCLWSQSPQMEVCTQGQSHLQVALFCAQRPESLRWNGTKTAVEYDSAAYLVNLRTFTVA